HSRRSSSLINRFLACVCLAAGSLAIAMAAEVTLPDRATILSTSEGPKIIRQCSRPGPENVSDFWMPAVADVLAAEKELPSLLRDSGHKIKLENTNRQYVGIIAHGKKLIYVNGFSVDPSMPHGWRASATIVCDGGDAFLGAEFNPVTKAFTHLEFNGP